MKAVLYYLIILFLASSVIWQLTVTSLLLFSFLHKNEREEKGLKIHKAGERAKRETPPKHTPFEVPVSTFAYPAGDTGLLENDSSKISAGDSLFFAKGFLIRKKTGEQIFINDRDFYIGRDRMRVNCCIEGNPTIGRVHCRIIQREKNAVLADLNAANGTFLNGIRLKPYEEAALRNGDRICLSDEQFEYRKG